MPLGSNRQRRRCRKTVQQDFPFTTKDPTLSLAENTGKRQGTLRAPEQTSTGVGPGLNPSNAGFQTDSRHEQSDSENTGSWVNRNALSMIIFTALPLSASGRT